MFRIYLFLKAKNQLINPLFLILLSCIFNSCTYQDPDSAEYVRPYQQQSVPIQRGRANDGYYYRPPQQYPGYGYQTPPASRYYSNPYAVPPQNVYPYYDGDQYYRPPSAYGTSDEVLPGNDRF